MKHDPLHIRNFCIIAHIDHGKSTLADRMLELTSAVGRRELREQMLDNMDLERERGISIKAHPVTMEYHSGHIIYEFNLIDTPGHVDFAYEVARSMAACEGAVLLVDAAQGVEAQTIANANMALEQGLAIIPVLNKIDLPNADIEWASKQIEDVLAIPMETVLFVSAKTGEGVPELMEAIVARIPPPSSKYSSTRALVFDSIYDSYRGAVAYVRVFEGKLQSGDDILLMSNHVHYEIKEVGRFLPKPKAVEKLKAGDVGYIIGNLKNTAEIQVGDTITDFRHPADEPLPGFRRVHPMVFTGFYPVDGADYERLKNGLAKLRLNDSSISYQPDNSIALGYGFRCGFLGLLHMEIVQERLRREYNIDLIATYPSVVYRVLLSDGSVEEVDNPAHWPDQSRIKEVREPVIRAYIVCLGEHIGDILQLIMDRRGRLLRTESIDNRRVMLTCLLPLNEILLDFHDRLKSISRGYASMDYQDAGYERADLVRLDILINREPVDAFSCIVHRSKAAQRGRSMCTTLKEIIPPQLFPVPIQAVIGNKVIARETIRAYRKDVTAKCYGGDITRKRKLLERQKAGKKKMKMVGKVSIPQKAFLEVLKVE